MIQNIRLMVLPFLPLAFADAESVLSSLLIQCLILLYRTLSEYNFPQFPETLHYLYKLAVEGPRRSEDSVITIIFFTEVSFTRRL